MPKSVYIFTLETGSAHDASVIVLSASDDVEAQKKLAEQLGLEEDDEDLDEYCVSGPLDPETLAWSWHA